MSSSTFVFAGADARFSNQVLAGMAATGASFCFIVLAVISFLAWNPVSRSQLDRVSFRILICALVANMFFGVAFTMCATVKQGHMHVCSFSTFLTQFCLDMSSWLIFSIALNLVLVLIFKVNGQKMEKIYICFSFFMSLCTSVPPYAMNQYGWDPLLETCWYRSDHDAERLRWQIGTQLAWTMTIVMGETVCFLSVLFYMLRHELLYGNDLKSIRVRTETKFTGTQSHSSRSHAYRFRGIILRIGLYPLASWMLNITTVGFDIYQTTSGGIRNRTQFRLFVTDNVFYGGRAIVYALLAATDPSLVRAIRALIQHRRGEEDEPITYWRNGVSSGQMTQLAVHVELQEIRHIDGEETSRPEFENMSEQRLPDISSMKSAEAKAAACDVASVRSGKSKSSQRQEDAQDAQDAQDAEDAQNFSRQI